MVANRSISRTAGSTQELASKEAAAFKSLLRYYELKQYKKTIKTADSILKKYPDHGESLSMKGLAMNALNKKEEAYALVKQGLRSNLKSHICWHVFGLVHRSDRNYHEAIKCYQNALKFEPDNTQVLRDLSLLQVQTRDLSGFQKTRRALLTLGASTRTNWFAYSVSHHLSGNYKMALAIWDCYYQALSNDRERPTYEESEMLLYKAQLLHEDGRPEECLEFLKFAKVDILDLTSYREKRASLLLELKRFDLAEKAYQFLIDQNPENYKYHQGLQASLLGVTSCADLSRCELPVLFNNPTPEQLELLKNKYNTMHASKNRVWAFQRIPLDFLLGDEYEKAAEKFLKKCLRKGVPSLFSFFKPMYKTSLFHEREKKQIFCPKNRIPSEQSIQDAKAKLSCVGKLVNGFYNTLKESGKFPNEDEVELPTVLLWTMYFLAQHHDVIGEHEKALEYVDLAIEHTPTLLDLYQCKSHILKHMGDLTGAVDAVEQGRLLDLADRYTNGKSTKYMLRANMDAKADAVVSLFTKHEGDSRANLFEMQCMWYELECGKSKVDCNDVKMGLKYYTSVLKHFEDFKEDQFDFHSYCLRKGTLRSYVALLKMEDDIREHENFAKGAIGAIRCYLLMHDCPAQYKPETATEEDLSKMTGAEKKKYKQKMRSIAAKKKKEKERQEAEALAKKKAEEDAAKDAPRHKRVRKLPVDADPDGKVQYETALKDPLGLAHKLVKQMNAKHLPSILAMFQVQVRRRKYLQALSLLKKACGVAHDGVNNPEVHAVLIPFLYYLQKGVVTFGPWVGASTTQADCAKPVKVALSLSEATRNVVKAVTTELLGDKDLLELAKTYLKNVTSSTKTYRKTAAIKALMMIQPENTEALLDQLVELTKDEKTLTAVQDVHEVIKVFGNGNAVVEKHRELCQTRFPRSTYFAAK